DVGISIESYNFNIGYTHADYEVKTRVEALVILRQAVSFFIKVREQLGGELAAEFGDNPKWFRE
nr:hypothetical protein [Ruminococcus sp.]